MNSSPANEPPKTSEFAENLEHLRQVPFFSGVPLEVLKVLTYLCTREIFQPGESLFKQGEQDGRAYYILEGKAELVLGSAEGGERVLATFGQGDFLGGLSLVADARRLFTLRAEERVACLCLTREKFTRTMERFPEMVPLVLEAVVKSVQDWEHRFVADRLEVCGLCEERLGVSLL